jgi:hypothetical protein
MSRLALFARAPRTEATAKGAGQYGEGSAADGNERVRAMKAMTAELADLLPPTVPEVRRLLFALVW